MNTHTNLGRRLVAALGAAALGLVGVAGVANAAGDEIGDTTPVTGFGNIDTSRTGTLNIHKYAGDQGDEGDGTEQTIDTATHTPLEGVQFKVQQVTKANGKDIDLTTPEGWDAIQALTVAQAETGTLSEASDSPVTTDENGLATLSGLPLGLYLVSETSPGENTIVSKVPPFLVTLPLPTGNGNWLYDVNVYPKNQVLGAPKKTINKDEDQTGVKIGDTVTYTINQLVPRLNEGEEYTQAFIYDILNADELKYAATTSVSLNGTALEAADYDIAADGSSWTLTADGLEKIKAGDTLTVVFTAKVLKVTETGAVANGPGNGEPGAPGYGSTFNGTTTPGGITPYTYWGQLKVTKVDEGGNNLADAEFSVFAKTGDSCAADLPSGDPVATGKSDATGVVQWNSTPTSPLGLWIANSNDGPLTNPTRDYCLYETKAPAGFVLDKEVKTVTISAGTVNAFTQKVTNVQQDHPKLPLTGANGQMLALIGGGALVLLAGGTALVARKRSHRD